MKDKPEHYTYNVGYKIIHEIISSDPPITATVWGHCQALSEELGKLQALRLNTMFF